MTSWKRCSCGFLYHTQGMFQSKRHRERHNMMKGGETIIEKECDSRMFDLTCSKCRQKIIWERKLGNCKFSHIRQSSNNFARKDH